MSARASREVKSRVAHEDWRVQCALPLLQTTFTLCTFLSRKQSRIRVKQTHVQSTIQDWMFLQHLASPVHTANPRQSGAVWEALPLSVLPSLNSHIWIWQESSLGKGTRYQVWQIRVWFLDPHGERRSDCHKNWPPHPHTWTNSMW